MRAPVDCLGVLASRISAWEEDDDTGNSFEPSVLREANQAAEELLLDIKQCLESVIDQLAAPREAQAAIGKETHELVLPLPLP